MSRIALATALLVAAALAGCAAGDGEGQLPTDLEGEGSTTGPTPDSTNTTRDEGNATEDNRTVTLTVSPGGPAPLNVTIQYDAQGADANESANLTWTLVMWRSGDAEGGNATSGNATAGNGTAGNGTGNGTAGNGTTESGSTTTGPGNGTAGGNATSASTTTGPGPGTAGGNSTAGNGTAGNGTSQGPPQPGNGTANRTASNFTLEVNGTAADLPGHTEQRLNVTGRYEVVFAVDFGNGTWFHRNATIDVGPMEPGTPLGNETAQFTGTFLASEPALCMGSEEFTWVLNATKDGIPAEVDFVAATVDADGVSDFVLTLVAPNGTEVASGPSINETGTFEAGNYTLRAESCVAVDTAYTVTALARYVAARAGGVAG